MSGINRTEEQFSGQFQVLAAEEDSQSSEQYEVLNAQQATLPENKYVGITIDQSNFHITNQKKKRQELDQDEWKKFIMQSKLRFSSKIEDTQEQQESKMRLTVLQINSILNIRAEKTVKRMDLWSIISESSTAQGQQGDWSQQDRERMLTILGYQLTSDEITALRKNCFKINTILSQLATGQSCQARHIRTHQKEMMQWIYDMLVRYSIQDTQIRYCKGIEYVCLGVVIAYPNCDPKQYTKIFYHLMRTQGLRVLFLQGFSWYFRELNSIRQYLNTHCHNIYQAIVKRQGDFKNLFITYFRTCLIHRVSSPCLIRKIFQMLTIEGLPLIKTILMRIVVKMEKIDWQSKDLLSQIATKLVTGYFREGASEQEVTKKFQNLFLI